MRNLRSILKFMTSQTGIQRITINILPDISKAIEAFLRLLTYKEIREELRLILDESLVPN